MVMSNNFFLSDFESTEIALKRADFLTLLGSKILIPPELCNLIRLPDLVCFG